MVATRPVGVVSLRRREGKSREEGGRGGGRSGGVSERGRELGGEERCDGLLCDVLEDHVCEGRKAKNQLSSIVLYRRLHREMTRELYVLT